MKTIKHKKILKLKKNCSRNNPKPKNIPELEKYVKFKKRQEWK